MSGYPKKRPTRKPSHPGEILKEVWLDELEYSQAYFAELLAQASNTQIKKSTMQTKINEVISGKRAISAEFAVLISWISRD